MFLGQCYEESGRFSEAAEQLRKVVDKVPQLRTKAFNIFRRTERFDYAAELAEKVIKTASKDLKLHTELIEYYARTDGDLRKLAQALLNAFRITEAHQVTQDLTSLPKATVTDWKLRGTAALRADAPSDTIIAYKKALSLDPNAAVPPYKELITPAPPTFRLKGFDLPPDREGSIRSTESKRRGTMIFRNQTAYTLEIFYLNGDGKRDGRYRRLPPGATYNQGTFFTHVWLVCDTKGRALGIFQTNKRSRTILLLEASTADPKP